MLVNAPPSMEHVETQFVDLGDCCGAERLREWMTLAKDKCEKPSDYQLPDDGYGAVFHRRYRLTFRCDLMPSELMAKVMAYPDRFSDSRLAKFTKTRGVEGKISVGDRFNIAISGPWDGPVEVLATDESSFAFVTLDDHLEAGFIRFSATAANDFLTFCIESWASSAGPIVWFTYSGIGASKKMQTKMWRHFCLKVASVVSGDVIGPIEIATGRIENIESDDDREATRA